MSAPPPPESGHRIAVPFAGLVAPACGAFQRDEPSAPEVAARLETVYAAAFARDEEALKTLYRPLHGPAAEGPRPADDAARCTAFLDRLSALLARANYVPLPRAALEAAVKHHAVPGLSIRVDFDRYDVLALHVRGGLRTSRTQRTWRSGGRRREVEFAAHERVVLIVRLRDEPGLHLKLFQDVPEVDVELLLPGAQLKMRWIDHVKIGGSGGTALVSLAIRAVTAAAIAPLWIFIGGATYAGSTAWRYLQAKDSYKTRLMREVFFQMLDSGEGVLTRLVDEAEEEEAKEAFLAWAAGAGLPGATRAEIRTRVEAHLKAAHGWTGPFDVADGLAKLAALGLATAPEAPDGPWRFVPAGVAAVRLAAHQVAGCARA